MQPKQPIFQLIQGGLVEDEPEPTFRYTHVAPAAIRDSSGDLHAAFEVTVDGDSFVFIRDSDSLIVTPLEG